MCYGAAPLPCRQGCTKCRARLPEIDKLILQHPVRTPGFDTRFASKFLVNDLASGTAWITQPQIANTWSTVAARPFPWHPAPMTVKDNPKGMLCISICCAHHHTKRYIQVQIPLDIVRHSHVSQHQVTFNCTLPSSIAGSLIVPRALTEQSVRHDSMRPDSASTVRFPRYDLNSKLPATYTQFTARPNPLCSRYDAVLLTGTVQRLLAPIIIDNIFRVKTKALRDWGATQLTSRLTSVLTHTMSPYTHLPTEPGDQSFLGRLCLASCRTTGAG